VRDAKGASDGVGVGLVGLSLTLTSIRAAVFVQMEVVDGLVDVEAHLMAGAGWFGSPVCGRGGIASRTTPAGHWEQSHGQSHRLFSSSKQSWRWALNDA
jgi:hypothetical protein